jgi:Ca2+-binding RTX toxin-like protein
MAPPPVLPVRAVALQQFDMSAIDSAEIDAATLVKNTATRVVYKNGTDQFAFVGSGLVLDGSNHPSDGVLTQITFYTNTTAQFSITNLSVDFKTVGDFIQAHDTEGLKAFLFSGDDNFVDSSSADGDVLQGYGGADRFIMTGGGADTVDGGNGDDVALFNDSFSANDTFDGGSGNDTLRLTGSVTTVFGATTIQNVENIVMSSGHDYDLTLDNGNIGTGHTLNVDAGALASFDLFTLDLSNVVDGTVNAIGGAGDDLFIAGSGTEILNGRGGDDEFDMGANFTAASRINGGDDNGKGDLIVLDGDYSGGVIFGALTVRNVEEIDLTGGHSYSLTTNNATVSPGADLLIDAEDLGRADVLTFNGAAEKDGTFTIFGGDGNDVITGGLGDDYIDGERGNNTINGGGGSDTLLGCDNHDVINGGDGSDFIDGEFSADTLTGGAGSDFFAYVDSLDSTSLGFDTITDFNADQDLFTLFFSPLVTVNTPVTTGALSLASFDNDLQAAIGAGQMDAGGAVLFTADTGDQAGKLFILIDMNGVAGYQATQDLVIYLQNATHMNDFSDLNFS